MNVSLKGKRALVCGSTQGIGLAIAQELALLGAHCTLLARNAERLEETVQRLDRSMDQQHQWFAVDFSDNAAVTNLLSAISTSPYHILVNNTGGPPAGKISEAKEQDFLSALNLHLINNHNITMALLPGMKSLGYGRIINIISTSVKIPLPNLGVSNTTRAAVASWAKTMANEVAIDGITVNNVLPGATSTQRLSSIIGNKSAKTGLSTEAVEEEMIHEIPMRRFGLPEEIAALAAFLATPAAAYITGQSICVDGGRTGSI
ncbi:MAG TPA: SDR family oxidoreductase [Chitinophagaceae bacterium]|nr:SDR family oxidoreductase [Chitinophagaceae bacterium]